MIREREARAAARTGAVCQAKVIRVDGTIEYRYSTSKHPWWDVRARLWVRRRLKAMKAEEGTR